ncbi:MAG: 30S ribosomal protein S17 [Methanomassiliicoccales archaeon]|jgi:small subunit ribosomal protein S17
MKGDVRDIGIDVKAPETTCDDKNCPFHGQLPVRGLSLDGVVVSTKMDKTAIVERKYLRYVEKYERYEKRTSRYAAHNPPCLGAKIGDKVTIMECRSISKTVSFTIIGKR